MIHITTYGYDEIIKASKEVQVMKRNITCEMIDFNPNIQNNEFFEFKARFYSTELNINLSNCIIKVKILSGSSMIYEENFFTDSLGMIEVSLFTSDNLTDGNFILFLELIGDNYYNDSVYEFQLFIESNLNEKSNSNNSDSEDKNDKNNKNIYSLSIALLLLGISFFTILFVYHNNIKKSKDQKLADLTCKY